MSIKLSEYCDLVMSTDKMPVAFEDKEGKSTYTI